jgi:hypothetical protein
VDLISFADERIIHQRGDQQQTAQDKNWYQKRHNKLLKTVDSPVGVILQEKGIKEKATLWKNRFLFFQQNGIS